MSMSSTHPDIEAYILGDDQARDASEAHIAGCEECMAEVGREARLELLLHAAGSEDAFAAVVEAPRRVRWSLVAAAGLAAAAAGAGAFALWPSSAIREQRTSAPVVVPTAQQPSGPRWAADIRPERSRCTDRGGDLMCAAASSHGLSRDEAEVDATDRASEALLDQALAHGDQAIRAQRAAFRAVSSLDPESIRRTRHQVASHTGLGQRSDWYWEEYEKPDGDGTEFLVFVRLHASADQVADFVAGHAMKTIDGAAIAPAIPSVRWVLDPGDDMAWFVHRPGPLAKVGVRAGDLLLHDPRRRLVDLRTMIARHQLRVWRDGRFR